MRRPRLLPALGGLLALLLVLLLVLPMLFKDKIAARVKTAVNQNVNARVDWRDLGVSFFRHFPNLTLTLDDLTAVGVGPLSGRHPGRGPPPRRVGQPAQRAGQCHGRERPDRGP